MQPANKDFVISLSFLNYLKEKTGMPKVMLEHQNLYLRSKISYIGLFSVKKSLLGDRFMPFCVYGLIIDGKFQGIFQMSQIINRIVDWCSNGHRLLDLHVHHLLYTKLHLVNDLLQTFAPVPIKVFLHDYHGCCSSFNLLKNNRFCGGEGLSDAHCADCPNYAKSLRIQPSIQQLYEKHLSRITFISPSNATRNIFLNFHPQYAEKTVVLPYQSFSGHNRENLEPVAPAEKLRIAYLGMPVFHKGWETWKKLVAQADPDQFEFIVFNSSDDVYPGMDKVKIQFSGENLSAMTDALRRKKAHIALLWAMCAETYSYTCFEAWAANAFLLTRPGSGNIADAVPQLGCGQVIDNEESLMALFRDPNKLRTMVNTYRSQTPGGPETVAENPQIVALSREGAVENSNFRKCSKPVNYPLLHVLNKIYRN